VWSVWIVVLICSAAVNVGVWGLVSRIYGNYERTEVVRTLDQLSVRLRQRTNAIALTVSQWAGEDAFRDAMYSAGGRTGGAPISAERLASEKLDFLFLYDADGKMVASSAVDRNTLGPALVPTVATQFLNSASGEVVTKATATLSGMATVDGNVLLIAASPIETPTGQVIAGRLAGGSVLDHDELAALGESYGLKLSAASKDDPQAADAFPPNAFSLGSPPQAITEGWLMPRALGGVALPDMLGYPGAVLFGQSSSVSVWGPERMFGYLAGSTLVLAAVAAWVVRALLRSHLVPAVTKLQEDIIQVRETGATKARLGEDSTCLAPVRNEVNLLLDAVARAGEEMAASENVLRAVVEGAPEAVIIIDEAGTVQTYNRAAQNIFGYLPRRIIGKNIRMLMPEPHRSLHDEYIEEYLRTGVAKVIGRGREVMAVRKDGGEFPLYLSVAETEVGEKRYFVAIVRDITQTKVVEENLKQAAAYDALTGLMTRRFFERQLEIAIRAARRHDHPLCLCMCDVDKFKSVNDTYGHQAGDEVLRRMGELIREELRQEDFAGRFGGDEFCICFLHQPAADAFNPIERLRKQMGCAKFGGAQGIPFFLVTGTFGLADLTETMDRKALFKAADQALYEAKEQGRNCTQIFRP